MLTLSQYRTSLTTTNNHDDSIHYTNSLLKTSKTEEVTETFSLSLSQNLGNEKEHTPIPIRIPNELRELEEVEQLKPLEDMDSLNQFLFIFGRTNSTLDRDAKQSVEALPIDFHDVFARHRFDIGINTEFTVHLIPFDKRLAYG